jgi:hypothetical protein
MSNIESLLSSFLNLCCLRLPRCRLTAIRPLANMRATPHTRNLIAMPVLVLAAAALAGCSTQSARTRASAECWMSIEKSHPEMNLDKRAAIVTKCIDDKMKAGIF